MNDPLRFVPTSDAQVEWARDQKHEWFVRDGLTGEGELAMVRVTMTTGQSHEFHRHPRMEEILYVLSGRCVQWVANEERELNAGDTVHIPMGMVHATHNPFPEPLVFLAIMTPAVFDGQETVDGVN
jgi:quercetin dioxygenase-like cupin family protein